MRPHQGVHVKGELDSEDMIEKVRRRGRSPRIDRRANCKTELGCWKRERERNRRSDRGKMKFYRRCNKCESLGEGLRTAVLRAVACSGHAAHMAIGTHAAHHWAARDTGWQGCLERKAKRLMRAEPPRVRSARLPRIGCAVSSADFEDSRRFPGGLCFGSHRAQNVHYCGRTSIPVTVA